MAATICAKEAKTTHTRPILIIPRLRIISFNSSPYRLKPLPKKIDRSLHLILSQNIFNNNNTNIAQLI